MGLSTVSCDNILDVKPLDSFTSEAIWGDLNMAQAYLFSAYNDLPCDQTSNVIYAVYTDEVFHKHNYASTNVTHCRMNPDNATMGYPSHLWSTWSYYYGNIAHINRFLDRIDEVPGDDDKRNSLKAEGLFLRAYNYIQLYGFYGRVVIVKKEHSLTDPFDETRSDLDEVADFIQGDLDEAISLFKQSGDSDDPARGSLGAALALKSRLLLWKASPLFGTPSQAKWQAASDAAKAVMDLHKYSLEKLTCGVPTDHEELLEAADKYAALYYSEASPEAIFEYVPDPNGWAMSSQFVMKDPAGVNFEGWSTFDPTQNLVNKFQTYKGEKQNIPYKEEELFDEWDDRDGKHYKESLGVRKVVYSTDLNGGTPYDELEIRFHANIISDGSIWLKGTSLGREVELWTPAYDADFAPGKDSNQGTYYWNATNTGYNFRKFIDPTYNRNSTQDMTVPAFYIRYAEVLLNYAECQLELGHEEEAMKYVNEIRNRALLPDWDPSLGSAKDAYRYERQMELLFDGTRYFDLKRWKELADVYTNEPIIGTSIVKLADGTKQYSLDTPIAQYEWKGDKYYWTPIPRSVHNASPQIDLMPYE